MTSPLLAARLVRADQTRTFHIRRAEPSGWEIAEDEDGRVVKRKHQGDWHRVERTLARYLRAITDLREQGWREA